MPASPTVSHKNYEQVEEQESHWIDGIQLHMPASQTVEEQESHWDDGMRIEPWKILASDLCSLSCSYA
jgi:hypothetical protein